ncbi:hypothetical protein MHU86_11537 [Fragilaria crotonensis]|nr:hypothetical protein MHU86_11537 [Fragilaria crotonensis]
MKRRLLLTKTTMKNSTRKTKMTTNKKQTIIITIMANKMCPMMNDQQFPTIDLVPPVPSVAASEAVIVEAEETDDDDEEVLTATAIVETSADGESAKKRKRPGPKPKRRRIESDREEAAAEARAMLQHTVTRLPMAVGESHVVRAMGSICTDDERFWNSHHIYPVGFSCDRYEFSPVHGRILKLRCSVLDGRKVRAKQKDLDMGVTASDGPLFRIMWGGGIDDESDTPFAVQKLEPEEGMRVRVKYERNQWYSGTIVDVDETANGETEISVQYDDGSTERAIYPDSDITLFPPGSQYESLENGKLNVTEMNGKPVTTVIATSAIQAWGQALLAMGLLDEITLECALGTVETSRGKKQLDADFVDPTGDDVNKTETEREEETEEELELRRKVKAAKLELDQARADDQEASIELADARLSCIGPFLCNPFQDREAHYAQQVSWLTTVIRKEKAKMGSTGNKKKVVTAIDLLERNNTFFNSDIEALVEGLPGSEMLSNYSFHSFRAGFIPSATSEAWQQHGHRRPPRPSETNKRKPPVEPKPVKQSTVDLEREFKRQKRDDERDTRKRQKDEEVEQKRKARADERLSRLSIQVDERLFKEACFQREKVILAMAKSLSREYNRRRKAAELIAMQSVVDDSDNTVGSSIESCSQELSPLCQLFDEDVLRCWDFLSSYGESLVQWGYIDKIPTLDSIQNALDSLSADDRQSNTLMSRSDAVAYLTDLLRAAFFAEVRTNATKEEADGPSSSDLLPVNTLTWQEVARLAFLSDALGNLEIRNMKLPTFTWIPKHGASELQGSETIAKNGGFPIATIRQVISQGANSQIVQRVSNETRVRILAPCKPSSEPPSWMFYLHNIKGLNGKKLPLIKRNLEKAIENAKSSEVMKTLDDTVVAEMEKALTVFEKIAKINEPTTAEASTCSRARTSLLRLLDKAPGGVDSSDSEVGVANRDNFAVPLGRDAMTRGVEMKLGLRRDLAMNEKLYKEICHAREEYMADALTLKEEMEHQDEDADDDDDDDEDNAKDPENAIQRSSQQLDEGEKVKDSPVPMNAVAQTAEVVATVVGNGDDIVKNDLPTKIGKVTPYDDFCGDIPTAPELIRRCLAVLRVLSQTNAAEPFVYPVDPQTNPGYYESILHPMCLREIGKRLTAAANEHAKLNDPLKALPFVESTVAQFARNVRLITQNCSCYPSAGATVIAAGDELLRIFERLLLDWVLSPRSILPSIEDLDDDKCVEFHDSDDDSLVLLCDGCEGKYNMGRLDPPLRDVPKGDWFCPRCLSGRCWESLDPRKDKVLKRSSKQGEEQHWTVRRSYFVH